MNKDSLSVTRCEKKYLISIPDYTILSSQLENVLQRDPNSKEDGDYYIRSLYFDSMNDGDFYAKEDGLYERKKIRLRQYQLKEKNIKLEAKRKYGKYMQKETAFIEYDDVDRLVTRDYNCLHKYNNKTTDSIYKDLMLNQMVPKVIIDYEREAYVDHQLNIRINFDKNIRTSSDVSIFDDDLLMTPVQDNDYYVLEVKYNECLPVYIQSILSSFNLIETSYSKYALSRHMVH